MDSPIVMLIGAFIAIAIMMALAVAIMSGFSESMACHELPGFNGSTVADQANPDKYKANTWGATCMEIQASTQNSLGLMAVILTVVAAVVILIVIRYL